MLGLPGFVVLGVNEIDDELEVVIETTACRVVVTAVLQLVLVDRGAHLPVVAVGSPSHSRTCR